LPASAAEDATRRQQEAARLRTRLRKIDAAEDAHVREVQALAKLDPNAPAVKAMRERHLRAFGELETERGQVGDKLAALTAIITATGITDLAAYLNDHATTGDLSRHPGAAVLP